MTVFNLHSIALVTIGLGTIIFVNLARAAFRRELWRVPGPWLARFLPFWRVFFVHRGDAHIRYRELHDRYGPIVRTAPNVVDISDPTVIPTIYGIGSKYYKSRFYDVFSVFYKNESMHSMFSESDPEKHQALKRPVASKFSMTSIRTLEYLVDPCSERFTTAMLEMHGQVIDLGVWVQWYAFDVIGAITFGKPFGFMEQREDVHNVIAGLEAGLRYAGLIGQVPSLHWYLLGNLRFLNAVTKLVPAIKSPIPIVTQMVEDAIAEYDAGQRETVNNADFLAYLREQEGTKMSTRDLMNHLMNNLLAGSDTTAISLRAIFYYLLHNPSAYQTLQREVDDAHQAGKLSPVITYAESLELKYLQLCIKEAMRLCPGVSYPLERVVPPEGAVLGGTFLPGGTTVGVNAAVIHRNRAIYGDDADQFRPERWLGDPDTVKAMDRNLLTFGAGVRTCIGKNISIMEVGKLVPQMLRRFDLEWASSEPEWQVSTYWFAKQSGVLVRFKPRYQLT